MYFVIKEEKEAKEENVSYKVKGGAVILVKATTGFLVGMLRTLLVSR